MSEEIPRASGDERASDDARPHVIAKADQEHRLLARLAKRSEWIIPQRVFESGPEVLTVITEDEKADTRERIAAMRTLVMMANANTGAQSVEVRINQAIAIVPESPAEVNLEIQPAFTEVVSTDNMGSTVDVLEELGLLGRYVDQVKTSAPPLPSNGNGGLN